MLEGFADIRNIPISNNVPSSVMSWQILMQAVYLDILKGQLMLVFLVVKL